MKIRAKFNLPDVAQHSVSKHTAVGVILWEITQQDINVVARALALFLQRTRTFRDIPR